jgi:homoserine kinase type II
MSVYTPVTPDELDAWLTRYALGALVELAPIAAGIENTNYFVTTERGRFVLTLYERLPSDELPFYLNLMAHLARSGVEVPAPAPDRTGALFSVLNGRPAGLVARIDGTPGLSPLRSRLRGGRQRTRAAARRSAALSRAAHEPARSGVVASGGARSAAVPRRRAERIAAGRGPVPDRFRQGHATEGAIHGDLFCDNVLFAKGRVAGIIDFGFAATDFFAYDLAIAVNDWCIGDAASGSLDAARTKAMVRAYHAVRPLTDDERTQWMALLRAAALRFWVSRLYDLYLPRPGELTHAHDPTPFERILRARAAAPARPLEL